VFCDAVTLGANGQIVGIVRQFENLDAFETQGIDFEAGYQTSVDGLFGGGDGDLQFRLLANYTDKLATTASLNGVTRDIAGQFGTPHWTVIGTGRYAGDRFGAAVDLRWYEGGSINNQLVEGEISRDGVNINEVSPTLYTNLTLDYDFSENRDNRMQLFVRIANLFNQGPPFPVSGEGRTLYDPVGRYYKAGVRFKF